MGQHHDRPVCKWKDTLALAANSTTSNPTDMHSAVRGYVLVGDNIDKRVNPREMRIDRQVQSLHYFHTYAAKNRCESIHSQDTNPIRDISKLSLSAFLLTPSECMDIRNNYVVLVSRIIVEYLPAFNKFKQCVPKHVLHSYSDVMSGKSVMVSVLGVFIIWYICFLIFLFISRSL